MAMRVFSDRSWRAQTLRATTALIPIPRPTNAPHPGLHRTREGGPAWEAGLAKLRERVGQGWRGLEGALDRMGPSQNSQEDIPTLVYNALLGKFNQ